MGARPGTAETTALPLPEIPANFGQKYRMTRQSAIIRQIRPSAQPPESSKLVKGRSIAGRDVRIGAV